MVLVRNVVLIVSLVFISMAASARVGGVSAPQSFTDSNGKTGVKAMVRCTTTENSRTIIKIEGERKWCDSVVTSLCENQKLRVAKKVCSISYKSLLSDQTSSESIATVEADNAVQTSVKDSVADKAAPTASKLNKERSIEIAAAQSELLDIEQQRLTVRQRQLELRKRELQLQRQQATEINSGS